MRLVYYDKLKPGLVIAYAWLPMWLSTNVEALDAAIKEASSKIVGKDERKLTDHDQREMDRAVVNSLCRSFPYVLGLRDLLEALQAVDLDDKSAPVKAPIMRLVKE